MCLDSLYPNLIVQYNISTETLVKNPEVYVPPDHQKYLEDSYSLPEDIVSKHNYAVSGNGMCYRKDRQGIFPKIIEKYYADRVKIKSKMNSLRKEVEENKNISAQKEIEKLNTEQTAIKTLMNSLSVQWETSISTTMMFVMLEQ